MGYETRYEVEWDNPQVTENQVVDLLVHPLFGLDMAEDGLVKASDRYNTEDSRIRKTADVRSAIRTIIRGNQPDKWYSHKANMEAVSQQFPGVLFTVHGVGEEFPDAWRLYVRNGKSHKVTAEISYPAFNNEV